MSTSAADDSTANIGTRTRAPQAAASSSHGASSSSGFDRSADAVTDSIGREGTRGDKRKGDTAPLAAVQPGLKVYESDEPHCYREDHLGFVPMEA